jgi:hypothetical protein
VLAVIHLGVTEERAARRFRSRQLAAEGKSCRDISKYLGISPAQAARLSRPEKGEALKCPRIDDLPSPVYRRAAFPLASRREDKSQEETGTPEGGATALFSVAAVRRR